MRFLIMVTMTLVFLAGCSGGGIKPGKVETAALVKVAPLKRGSLASEIGADGEVKANQTATVSGNPSGRVVRIGAKVGEKVEAGEPLIWVEDPLAPSNIRRLTAQVEGARAQVAEARANTAQTAGQKDADVIQAGSNVKVASIAVEKARAALQSAQTELTRKQDLLTKKALAQTDVEKARLSRDQAEADLRTSQVQLDAAKDKLTAAKASLSVTIQRTQEDSAAASLRQAEADLESALAQSSQDILRSPISGVVAESNVQLGQDPATVSQPLMVITDNTKLRIQASFDERYAARIRPGLQGDCRPVTEPDKVIPLVVERVTPESKQSLVTVILRANEKDLPGLTPDSYVRVRLALDTAEGILIPIGAVIWGDQGGSSVMIAQSGRARSRTITIADQDESQVLVTTDEVKPEELLIVEGQTGLRDGAEVRYEK